MKKYHLKYVMIFDAAIFAFHSDSIPAVIQVFALRRFVFTHQPSSIFALDRRVKTRINLVALFSSC